MKLLQNMRLDCEIVFEKLRYLRKRNRDKFNNALNEKNSRYKWTNFFKPSKILDKIPRSVVATTDLNSNAFILKTDINPDKNALKRV
jgi:hypothetical protein